MSFPTIQHRPHAPIRFGRMHQVGPTEEQLPPEVPAKPSLQTDVAELANLPFKTVPHTPQNGIWVTTERLPAKVGGLGEVSKTIPEAIARLMPNKDLRIIVPYLTAHAEADARAKSENRPQDAFQETGVTLKLACHDGKNRNFDILQKFEPVPGMDKRDMQKIGNWVYAIRNDELFRAKIKVNGVEQDAGLQKYTYNPKAGEYEKVMLFNRAAAGLIPLLNGNSSEMKDSRLSRFNRNGKNIDFVMAHDWLAGPVLHELPDDPNTRKIFMLHNKYDKIQIPKVAKQTGLFMPGTLYDDELLYSPLQMGIESADVVIGEHNFVKTLLETPVGAGLQFIPALREKYEITQQDSQRPALYDMHHGLSADFTPLKTGAPPALRQNKQAWLQNSLKGIETKLKTQKKSAADIEAAKAAFLKKAETIQDFQFQPLESTSLEDIKKFKAANKEALQKKLGLEVNPNATIIGWAARLEPRQKGFFLVQYCMEKLLESQKDKNLQFVIYGDTHDKALQGWIKKMLAQYPGQIYMPNAFGGQDDIKHLSAGGDFTILPSIYEPYGLTQLEAMKMSSIPVVHGVDGLRSSIADNKEGIKSAFGVDLDDAAQVAQLKKNKKWENVWGWQPDQQNGFLMAPLNLQAYQDYIDRRQECEEVNDLVDMVDSPDSASQKFNYNDRITHLAQKLKDSIGSRKSQLTNIKKELPLGITLTQELAQETPASQRVLDALGATRSAQVLSYAQMAKRRLGYTQVLNNAEVMSILKPQLDEAALLRANQLNQVEHEKRFTATQDKAKQNLLDNRANVLKAEMQSIREWQQEIETSKALKPESQQAIQAFFTKAVHTEAAEIEKKDALIHQARKLNREIQQITKVKKAMEDTGRLSPAAKIALKKIFSLSDTEVKVNEIESGKLLAAMQRALNTDPQRLLQIRQNGMNFVDTEHNWDKIISQRYKSVMEDPTVLSRRKARELPTPGTAQNKPPIRKILVERPNIPATPSPERNDSSSFSSVFFTMTSKLMDMLVRLLSYLMRPFSFKMD